MEIPISHSKGRGFDAAFAKLLWPLVSFGFHIRLDTSMVLCATLLYSCAVYHSSALMTSSQPVKIPFQGCAMTKIFSHVDDFTPALAKYVRGVGARPEPHVHLLCGQSVNADQMDSRVLVRARVTSHYAVDELRAADKSVQKRR